MKKIFGFTIGGLQHKILALVLVVLLLTVSGGLIISSLKSNNLTSIVESARNAQQEAIENVSKDTMHQVVESTMSKSNALQARIADDLFISVKNDVFMLKTLAQDMFLNADRIEPGVVYPPDPSNDGQVTAQVLCEDGVDYTESKYLPIAANMAATMEAMYTSAVYTTNVYIGFEDGTHLGVDRMSSDKIDENGNVVSFPVRSRPWYTAAKEAGDIVFSGVMKDTFTDNICVTCSAPIIVNNQMLGVVGIDIFLDDLEEYVRNSTSSGSFLSIINEKGQVIFAPEGNPLFTVSLAEDAEDLRQSDNRELAEFVSASQKSSTGLQTLNIGGKDYYLTGSPLSTIGWSVLSAVEKDVAETPTKWMLEEYDRINADASKTYLDGTITLRRLMYLGVTLLLLIAVVASWLVSRKIVKPIESMTQEIIESSKTGKYFEIKDIYRTNDEIEVLAESFEDLSQKTKSYIDNIKTITKEKERIKTELSLATTIQAAMLPHIFPPYPDRHEFDIYATMEPAKEVGGDFYDFFLIDSNHLCLVMADVSGKGIPAALFMMISKTILQSCAMLGKSAAEILTKTNDALCSNNQAEMFVTVWLGILEISTGKMTCANAGHEYPVLKRSDGSFEIFKDKHGIAIGCMDGIRYKEYEMELHPGDKLFLYTDGVPEATDSTEEMFGLDRMLAALNKDPAASPQELLHNVREAVGDFVKEAEQFDDLTMMSLDYRDNQTKKNDPA